MRGLNAVSLQTLLAAGALAVLVVSGSACSGEAQTSPPPTATTTPAATPTPAPTTPLTPAATATPAVTAMPTATATATAAGSHAFLSDTGVITTYEGLRDGSATMLRINLTDADGTSRASFLRQRRGG